MCRILPNCSRARAPLRRGIGCWWRSEALGQVAVTLFAAVVATYLARLLMLYFP
jgi:hypothetical protein